MPAKTFRSLATRIPQQWLHRINWADPPPDGMDGDGLLVVRSAKDLRSGVVLFLQGEQVVSAVPADYRLLLVDRDS